MKAVLFSISKGNYNTIIKFFYDYYEYLAGLFQSCGSKPVKFIIVTSENIKCFDSCSNVIQVRHLPYNQYLLLLKSSDLVLSDTFWSTSIAFAAFVGIPSVLLCNTHVSKEEKTQRSNDINWSDFRGRLNLDDIQSRDIKHLINCHKDKLSELCHNPAEEVNLSPFEYLNNKFTDLNPKPSDDTIIQELLNFLSNHKMPGTNETYLKLHEMDKSMVTKKIIEILTGKQKQTFQKWNIHSLLDIDTGHDSFKKSLSELMKKCSEPKKAYFRPDNLYPYKIFPYGMLDISNYLIAQFHFKECFVENEIFNKENFSQKISDMLFNEKVYQPVIEKCKEFQARYDNVPYPLGIVEEVLSQKY